MKALHLTLKKKWFDLILSGDKKIEYRDYKPYWTTRLENKEYDYIHFVNGYGKDRPWMDVKIVCILRSLKTSKDRKYEIHLGKILDCGNLKIIGFKGINFLETGAAYYKVL